MDSHSIVRRSMSMSFYRLRKAAGSGAPRIPIHSKLKNKAAPSIILNANDSPLIISCQRSRYNHYKGNRYGGNPIDLKYLASGGWLHYKSKGDYFTINPFAKQHHFSQQKFSDLGLNPRICQVISNLNYTKPTRIQAQTMPEILQRNNVICAAETGSGKTMAYLLPILQHILFYKESYSPAGITAPRAVILVPSRELTTQIYNVAGEVCEALGLSLLEVSGKSTSNRTIASLKSKPRIVDLLITTPVFLNTLFRTKAVSQNFINHVVLDEADTITDDSFSRATAAALQLISLKPSGIEGTQTVLASATYPSDISSHLTDILNIESFIDCSTDRVQGVIGNISQRFSRMGPQEKMEALVNRIKKLRSDEVPTMVFANASSTAHYLNNLLAENGVPNILLHGGVPDQERCTRYAEFKSGECQTLVCTDIASRGLDTTHVGVIVNYDFPLHITDYIHRAGRIGRIGSQHSGRLYNLIGRRPEISNVWAVERAVRSNRGLVGVKTSSRPQSSQRSNPFQKPRMIDVKHLHKRESRISL